MLTLSSAPVFLPLYQNSPELPLLVLMPGMDGTGYLWRSQLPQLETFFDVRRLQIPARNLENWEELTSQVINLIQQETLGTREVYICGESFGACLALKLAVCLPNLYHRLILINPASSFSQLPWLGWLGQACQWLPDSLYHFSTLAGLPLLAALEKINHDERRALLEAVRSVPQTTVAWRIKMLADFQVNAQALRELQQPVLILVGESDRLLPSFKESQRLQNYLPQAQIVTLPKSGHACMLETGICLNQILQKWLKNQ